MSSTATLPHPGRPVAETALVNRVRAGDPAAEAELARRFGPRMRALCLARTQRADRAAELADDAMIALLIALRRGALRDPVALPTFAAEIARHTVATSSR